MIRKFGRVNAPPEVVRSLYLEAESWPTWQAGVTTATVIERTDTTIEVEVDGRFMGQRMHGVFDCRIEPDGFYQHQRTGWLKRWDTRWRFLTPPDGRGTTLVCELEIDAGIMGSFVPKSFLRRFVDRAFSETLDNLNARAAEIGAPALASPASDGGAVTLLEVFETPIGFEVLVGGRRITLRSKD
jgi:hypothetical protein